MTATKPVPETTLITGASSGIGRELAIVCAAHGMHLVLVARSGEKLAALAEELQSRHGVSVTATPSDLAETDSPRRLFDQLSRDGVQIDCLVNNAGFGGFGLFAELETAEQVAMIQLNATALTHLTQLFLPAMLERGRGRILNVASTAAFQPGPLMAVYYATKAYVLSFSEALAEELRGTGVTVTALCPGPTSSGFQKRANMRESGLMRLGLMGAQRVAEEGYRAMMKGKVVHVPGLQNKLLAQSIRLSPRSVVRRVVKELQAKSR